MLNLACHFKYNLLNLTDRHQLEEADKMVVDSTIQHIEQNPRRNQNNNRGRGRGGYRGRGGFRENG